jgi:hypothetical protein
MNIRNEDLRSEGKTEAQAHAAGVLPRSAEPETQLFVASLSGMWILV